MANRKKIARDNEGEMQFDRTPLIMLAAVSAAPVKHACALRLPSEMARSLNQFSRGEPT
jgi:hypothetical protein